MRTRLPFTIVCLLGMFCPATLKAETPNIVVILCDDLGYGDVGCYNADSKIATPNVDRLAARGIRFTDAHTPSAVCTPTRYGLLTGRYCWRTRLKDGVLDGFDPPLIEPGRMTLASLARQYGYSTACVGKWHLGADWIKSDGQPMPFRGGGAAFRPGKEVDFTRELRGGPLESGFDSYFGISASLDMSPYCFIEKGGHRVPFIVRWPQRVQGGVVTGSLVELTDVLATFAAILDAKLPVDAGEDSISFLPTLMNPNGAGPTRRFSVHHSQRGVFALREGPWKFVPSRGSGGFSTPRTVTPRQGEPEGQLYQLEDDPAETRNVWQQHPEIVARLSERLRSIQAGSGTAIPRETPP